MVGVRPVRAVRTAREELLAMQRRLVGKIRRGIAGLVRREAPRLGPLLAAFARSTSRYDRISTRDELVAEVASAGIAFVGDFHTLRQAQQTPVRLLHEILARPAFVRGERRAWLALEMVRARDQGHVDRYLRGELSDEGFLRATRWAASWGFHWPSCRVVLNFARRRGVPVMALNTEPTHGARDPIDARERSAAGRIAAWCEEHPDDLLVALFGELHVSEGRLPRLVEEALARLGRERRAVVVYQNVDRLYWRLADEGLEHIVDVLRLRDGAYCVLNATPLAKLRSHLSWLERTGSPERFLPWYEDGAEDVDLAELVAEFARAIASFLGIRAPRLDGLEVVKAGDPEALRSAIPPELLPEAELALGTTGSAFLPEAGAIVFASYSMNHAAEESARLLAARESRVARTAPPGSEDGFYGLVWSKTLGYFGSKVINHKRLCYKERDYAQYARRPDGQAGIQKVRQVARRVLSHRDAEVSFLAGAPFAQPFRVTRMDGVVRVAVAQALGHMLGDRLYDAMILEFVPKAEIRGLFRRPVSAPGAAREAYLDLVKRLQYVTEFYRSRWDRL